MLDRLQNQLETLNMADIPEIDLFDYNECSQCALAFVRHTFDATSTEREIECSNFVFKSTEALIKAHKDRGIFPWKVFLSGVFDMKLRLLEERETIEKQIYFYLESSDPSPGLSVISLLQAQLLNETSVTEYQSKPTEPVSPIAQESEEDEEFVYQRIEEFCNEVEIFSENVIRPAETESPPAKR